MAAEKIFVMLAAGRLQVPMIRAAHDLGYTTLVLDQNDKAEGRSVADIFLPVQFADSAKLWPALEPYLSNIKLAATSGTDFSFVVAEINQRLGLPGIKPRQALVMTHKGEMRTHIKKHNLPQPDFICTSSKSEAESWATQNQNQNGFVIKPARNMGARGVMRIADWSHLCYAFEFSAAYDKDGIIVLEEYLPAHELSADALVKNGKVFLTGLADRIIEVKDQRYFIENGHTMPSQISPAHKEQVQQLLQQFAHAIESVGEGQYNGALKGDLRLTQDGKLYIGEIAGRLSGGYMSTHTFPYASDKNLMQAFIQLLSSEEVPWLGESEDKIYQRFSIERSLYAMPGQIADLADPEKLMQNFQNTQIFCNYNNNDIVKDLQNNVGKVYHTVITADSLEQAEQTWQAIFAQINFKTQIPQISRKEIERVARKSFNNAYCWVCQVCDGERCASGIPGMGGRGEMNSFRDNIRSLSEYKLIPRYIDTSSNAQVNTTFTLFGKKYAAPLLSAPITGALTNMGGSISEWDYAYETATAFSQANLLPCFGDGATFDKYRIGLKIISELATGLPVFKPRSDQNELIRRIQEAKAAGAIAWGMDIDGVSFKTMQLKSQATEHKSAEQIRELAEACDLPFFLKGIMSVADAEAACLAGASAIIISNHGGRVLDSVPGAARVISEIAQFVKKSYPHVRVLADGGIRSGTDIFKMLALGAEAVLVGRPIVIAAVGMGRAGVARLIELYLEELEQAMRVLGLARLEQIAPHHIRRFDLNHERPESNTGG